MNKLLDEFSETMMGMAFITILGWTGAMLAAVYFGIEVLVSRK